MGWAIDLVVFSPSSTSYFLAPTILGVHGGGGVLRERNLCIGQFPCSKLAYTPCLGSFPGMNKYYTVKNKVCAAHQIECVTFVAIGTLNKACFTHLCI